jgi:hypothetical protein
MGETAASNDGRPGRRRQEAPPMVAIAIVAAAGWLALYLGCAAITSDRHMRRGIRRFRLDGGPADLGDPALVNLVTTGCQLDGAAFAATILHHRRRSRVVRSPAWRRSWPSAWPNAAKSPDHACARDTRVRDGRGTRR